MHFINIAYCGNCCLWVRGCSWYAGLQDPYAGLYSLLYSRQLAKGRTTYLGSTQAIILERRITLLKILVNLIVPINYDFEAKIPVVRHESSWYALTYLLHLTFMEQRTESEI